MPFEVVNPATGETFAEAPDCPPGQLDATMAAAQRAFAAWGDAAHDNSRRAALAQTAGRIRAAEDELAALLTAEQGKPLSAARAEVQGTAQWFDYYAALKVPTEVIRSDESAHVEVRHVPLGVVAAITPWNFPLHLAAMKLAPSLRAGNAVVLKPSPFTPLATLRVGQLMAPLFPTGVVAVITGPDPLGAWMTSHAVPRKVSFTGSVNTGRLVARAAADTFKRVTLELGGNDAAIVLDDVDVDAVAGRLFWSAFANSGQICAAVKRLYVPGSLHDSLVDALMARAAKARVGDGAEDGVQLGPINNEPQLDRVIELVEDAKAAGGTVVCGGERLDRPGYFFPPTIVTGIADGVRLVDEEQFGPVLPVVTYDDVDAVIDRANGTDFGLSGSVWGGDVVRAEAVARRLECGTAWVNTHLDFGPEQPVSGMKSSGLGVENALAGLYGFTDYQVVHRSKRPA